MIRNIGKTALTVLLFAGLNACGSEDEKPQRTSNVATAPDGNLISYEVRGKGETTLVFIHCWACNRSFWEPQLSHFENSYKVVAMDLPGHGNSGATRTNWSIEGLGHDVVAVFNRLKIDKAILVGHSMGGPVALAAARQLKGRVSGIACVDTLHDLVQITPKAALEPFARALEMDFEGTLARMSDAMFQKDGDPAVKTFVLTQALKADRDAAVALMRGFADLDLAAFAQDADVSLRCINAAPLPPALPSTNLRDNQKHADYDVQIMQGVGHYLHLEQPDAFNERLEKIIEEFETASK